MCVCLGGVRRITILYIFLFSSFCRTLALNHVNFHFPTMFFSLQLYSISGNASYDERMVCNITYFPRVFQLNHDNGRVIWKETQFRFRCFKGTAFVFRPQ